MKVNAEVLKKMVNRISDSMEKHKVILTELDQAIGDGDHGINMERGFVHAVKTLEKLETKDCGEVVKTLAMCLLSTIGGAAGPLYGTAFLWMSQKLNGHEIIDFGDVDGLFQNAIDGIVVRGRTELGDKTIIDCLNPAYEAYKKARMDQLEPDEVMALILKEARQGTEATIDMIARKGRASYLGERSLGHQDPGASSCLLMIEAIIDVLKEE